MSSGAAPKLASSSNPFAATGQSFMPVMAETSIKATKPKDKVKSGKSSRNVSTSPGAKDPNPSDVHAIDSFELPRTVYGGKVDAVMNSPPRPTSVGLNSPYSPQPTVSESSQAAPLASQPKAAKRDAKSIHAHNERQLARLSSLSLLTKATHDLCDWQASSDIEARCLTSLCPIAEELSSAIRNAELQIDRLRDSHAIINPTSGARAGEDTKLSLTWATKENHFVDMLERHRDRYLKLQQGEALRLLADWEKDILISVIQDAERHSFAHNSVAREFLRPDC
eukprot:GILI01015754.1.p1 GENE.GILI01015754.1~~GILI01015754.1.p1  ORF type:complete len:281 (-),score=25.43 GILI01015754.1:28-870(-)